MKSLIYFDRYSSIVYYYLLKLKFIEGMHLRPFLWLYTGLFYLVTPFIIFSLLWQSRKNDAYRKHLLERFGFLAKETLKQNAARGRPVLIHCASVGEFLSARAFIAKFIQDGIPVWITCTTPTGRALINDFIKDKQAHCSYLPFDLPWSVKRFLKKIQPQKIVLFETEIWPNLIAQAHQRALPICLVNARMSERSFNKYKKSAFLFYRTWKQLSLCAVQDQTQAERFIELGVSKEQLYIFGNFKYDVQISSQQYQQIEQLKKQIQGRWVIVAGSTHAGEEHSILSAFERLLAKVPHALLILIPRHQERFAEVTQRVDDMSFHFQKRTDNELIREHTQVLIGDTLGELTLWYGLADLAFIGGSLIERGGHNPLEALLFQMPLLSGKHVFNFTEVYRLIEAEHGVQYVRNTEELYQQVLKIYQDYNKYKEYAEQAAKQIEIHRGAVDKTYQAVANTMQHYQVKKMRFVSQRTGFSLYYFFEDYWYHQQRVTGYSSGRHQVWFVQPQSEKHSQWVLRHYYRGGLLGKFIQRFFIFTGSDATRSFQEYQILLEMRRLQLPVPEPIAASYQRRGIGYQASIIITRLSGAQDLGRLLQQQALPLSAWQELGKWIAIFQQHLVYHSDLNCKNILWHEGEESFYLIDFDKCSFKTLAPSWQQEMLQRLKRSFVKEKQLNLESFYWSEEDWQALMAGYITAQLETNTNTIKPL